MEGIRMERMMSCEEVIRLGFVLFHLSSFGMLSWQVLECLNYVNGSSQSNVTRDTIEARKLKFPNGEKAMMIDQNPFPPGVTISTLTPMISEFEKSQSQENVSLGSSNGEKKRKLLEILSKCVDAMIVPKNEQGLTSKGTEVKQKQGQQQKMPFADIIREEEHRMGEKSIPVYKGRRFPNEFEHEFVIERGPIPKERYLRPYPRSVQNIHVRMVQNNQRQVVEIGEPVEKRIPLQQLLPRRNMWERVNSPQNREKKSFKAPPDTPANRWFSIELAIGRVRVQVFSGSGYVGFGYFRARAMSGSGILGFGLGLGSGRV
ncbi:hypothetical protein CCACVL1_29954 [Corchorus capsularis]|uniref:Uncharacterized protein n=1 Tax=Corchorus capsularis TaxID=210143 RepID=A0A1R3FZB5_COCAP|nr:hypothetical protein CCACVL1_29954 [Corchorus capsularis]